MNQAISITNAERIRFLNGLFGINCFKLVILLVLGVGLFSGSAHGQIGDYEKFADIRSSDFYNFEVREDLRYGVARTNYRRLNSSGTYDTVRQKNLELDLFLPITPSRIGKRAVVIMLPQGGRGGCRNGGVRRLEDGRIDPANGCNRETIVRNGRVDQEGLNFNHLNNRNAARYAQRGLVVASPVTRYTYEHTSFSANGSNRWFRTADGTRTGTNPRTLLSAGGAHLEFLVVDVKRVVRWLTANADRFNIDPNYIFIEGGSGAAKMASLAAVTNTRQLIVDDPANIDVAFERRHNNWDIRNSTPALKGLIMRKGDFHGNYNISLMDTMDSNTDSFMFWAGTADRSILHGNAEIVEEKCEILQTCFSQFYSIPNATHSSVSSARFEHTRSSPQTALGHIYDFIVNSIQKDDSQSTISISQRNTRFSESVGQARIEITRAGDASDEVTFTVSADQMREVTRENGRGGSFDLITRYVAKSSNSDGLVMYDDSTAYAYEDAVGGQLRRPSDRVVRHRRGKGAGQFTEISSGDAEYHGVDFTGRSRVMTMPAGQSRVVFNVPIRDDDLHEDNECFKVRILNAYGARIGNSVETFTIEDNDSVNPRTNGVCGNPRSASQPVSAPAPQPVSAPAPTTRPTINFTRVTRAAQEGNNLTIRVRASQSLSTGVSVEYQTRRGTASEADYVERSRIARIPAGQQGVDILIETTQDARDELNEQFTVELNRVTAGNARLGENDVVTVTIVDNDETSQTRTAPAPTQTTSAAASSQPRVSLSTSAKSILEGNGFSMMLRADRELSSNVSVEYQTRRGSALGTDYVERRRVATIPAGQQSVAIPIQTRQDQRIEGNEQFRLVLNGMVSGNAQLGSRTTSTITIVDDDANSPLVTFTRTDRALREGRTLGVTIEMNRAASRDVLVEFQTQRGSASAADFTERRRVVRIPAGQQRAAFAILTTQDRLEESNERFSIVLNRVTSNNARIGVDNRTRVTIVDDD